MLARARQLIVKRREPFRRLHNLNIAASHAYKSLRRRNPHVRVSANTHGADAPVWLPVAGHGRQIISRRHADGQIVHPLQLDIAGRKQDIV